MSNISCEMRTHYGIADDMLDIFRRDELIAEIRAARPDLTEGALRQEVFLLCYGDEFNPEQRETILAAIAAYWERKDHPDGTLPMDDMTEGLGTGRGQR